MPCARVTSELSRTPSCSLYCTDRIERRGTAVPTSFQAKVRMYRQGLGDCFLVTLPRSNGSNYFIMVDCGVVLGTPDASALLTDVVSDIVETTGGRIDLVLASHAHWDHVS